MRTIRLPGCKITDGKLWRPPLDKQKAAKAVEAGLNPKRTPSSKARAAKERPEAVESLGKV